MQLNFKNIGNNSCTTQGKILNKCTKKSLNPLKITGNSTFIDNIVKLNELSYLCCHYLYEHYKYTCGTF